MGLSPDRRTTSDRRSDRASRTRFRTERYAPVKSVSPDSPFIITQEYTRVGSVAEFRAASIVTVAIRCRTRDVTWFGSERVEDAH